MAPASWLLSAIAAEALCHSEWTALAVWLCRLKSQSGLFPCSHLFAVLCSLSDLPLCEAGSLVEEVVVHINLDTNRGPWKIKD